MKNLLFTFLLFSCAGLRAQVTVDWYNYPGGVSVATDASDNIYTATWDYNPAGDITLTRRNAAGSIIWNVSYDNTDNTRHEVATWVETDNMGNILVSGTIRSGYSNPVNAASVLMKYSPSGSLLWRVVYESSFDGSSTRKCLIDPNNNIYVLGIGTGPSGQVTKVKKFNASGAPVWNYFDAGIGAPVNFKFTPDNNILIVHRGITGSINGFSKIDLNGNNIWSLAGINSLSVGDAAGDAFGNSYIINGNYAAGSGSILKKLSPNGSVIWSQTNTMNGNRVEVGSDNQPVISGYPAAGYGAAFMKYNFNGVMLWENLDADGPATALLAHAQLKLDASNAAYVAGSTMSSMGICKVNSNGTTAWTATTPSGYPVCFDFGTDNSVYVTGGTTARFSQTNSSTVPAAPTNLTATAAVPGNIVLNWTDQANNETNYIVQRSLTSVNGFSTISTLPANSITYTNTGLPGGNTFYYRVQAVNAAAVSDWSNTAFATTLNTTAPAAPSNLRASATVCNQISLSWSDNSANESGFEISRSLYLNGTYTLLATVNANTTYYINTGLPRNKRYFYKVRAVNNAGNSAWSNSANTVTKCNATTISGPILQDIRLFPNPVTNEQLSIAIPPALILPVSVEIFSPYGRKVYARQLYTHQAMISTKGFEKGVYTVVLRNKQEVQSQKIIIH